MFIVLHFVLVKDYMNFALNDPLVALVGCCVTEYIQSSSWLAVEPWESCSNLGRDFTLIESLKAQLFPFSIHYIVLQL